MADQHRRVLITRAPEDAQLLGWLLEQQGFKPVIVPAIERLWEVEETTQRAAIGQFDRIVLTSAIAADVLAAAAPNLQVPIFAVGPATARRARQLGWSDITIPDRHTGANLVGLGGWDGLRVFYPRADMAGTRIADALRNWGAEVVDVVAYVNRCPSRFDADLRAALPVEISTIFSGSAAKRIADAVPDGRRGELGKVVVIGPSTAAATVAHGLHHHAMADPHTVAGMVAAVGSLPQ